MVYSPAVGFLCSFKQFGLYWEIGSVLFLGSGVPHREGFEGRAPGMDARIINLCLGLGPSGMAGLISCLCGELTIGLC